MILTCQSCKYKHFERLMVSKGQDGFNITLTYPSCLLRPSRRRDSRRSGEDSSRSCECGRSTPGFESLTDCFTFVFIFVKMIMASQNLEASFPCAEGLYVENAHSAVHRVGQHVGSVGTQHHPRHGVRVPADLGDDGVLPQVPHLDHVVDARAHHLARVLVEADCRHLRTRALDIGTLDQKNIFSAKMNT